MFADNHQTGSQRDLAAQDGKDAGSTEDIYAAVTYIQNNIDTPLPRSLRRPRRAKMRLLLDT